MREPPGPLWGRAASCCLSPHGCSGRRVACCAAGVPGAAWPAASLVFRVPRGLPWWAGPLCVPVGGGPPARSPHASLRLGVVDLEARPGPAAAHRHRGQALQASRRPPIGRGLLSVSYLPWFCRHPSAPRPGPTPSHHAYHSCTDTQFRMQFPHDCFKP